MAHATVLFEDRLTVRMKVRGRMHGLQRAEIGAQGIQLRIRPGKLRHDVVVHHKQDAQHGVQFVLRLVINQVPERER